MSRFSDGATSFHTPVPEGAVMSYARLHTDANTRVLEPTTDFFHNLDLVCSKDLLDSLEDICLDVGGQTWDVVYFGDVACSFLNEVYDRHVSLIDDGRIKVPLFLCGTTANCLMSFPKHHQIRVILRKQDRSVVQTQDYELWATCYDVPPTFLHETRTMVAQQTQFTGAEWIVPSGKQRIRLHFNKAAYCLAFHFGKHPMSIAKRVKCIVTEYDYDAKEYLAERTLFDKPIVSDTEYCMHTFAPDVAPPVIPETILDLSVLDYQYLEIEFTCETQEKIPVYVFAHTYDQPTFRGGMAGLRFSK